MQTGARAFRVDLQPDRDVVVVAPRGELDVATVPQLDAAVQEVVEAGFDRIRLDLRHLEFVDSCGLRTILRLARDESIALSVVPGPAAVQRVFEVTGVLREVPFTAAPRVPASLAVAA